MRSPFGGGKLVRRRNLFGLVFLIPWLIGAILFFGYPLLYSLWVSFQEVTFLRGGGLATAYVGFANYIDALTKDENFIRYASSTLLSLAVDVPVCLVFSFFVAVLLHQKFHGNFIAKAIFFLPVILGTGLFLSITSSGQYGSVQSTVEDGITSTGLFQSVNLANVLEDIGVPDNLTAYITGPVDQIYNVISQSGIQIFVFLAGLNAINASLYEAAYVEGANGWTAFWKITFPMVSPVIIINVVYSLIDNYTKSNNATMNYAWSVAFSSFNFGLANAMLWFYCLVLAIVVSVVFLIISKRVVYQS